MPIPKITEIIKNYKACQLTNTVANKKKSDSDHRRRLSAYWKIDFTEVKQRKCRYKYLLMFIYIVCGWTDAFPARQETTSMVTKKLLENIRPRCGFPQMTGSDSGPAFVSQVSQGLASILGIGLKLYCTYGPQSSGQVEMINKTLKETLSN